ncbi:sodium-dependent glucose transporter 1-like protein [Dinothrombium tinctorium]|uniref:Sodium-dependent glucose transporter 1-like protein n=1 Tax=Dinothrombium tinctorium TaxID=1965070 RepID=A0A443RAZ5_9ACAR|nr:sodium-dependent glucose transporter 1-like protein [Dinothrombium tinctorium]
MFVGTTIERMSFSISLRSASFSAGALIGGFIFNYLNRQIVYSIFLFLLGLSAFGLLSGACDTAVNVWMLEMWGHKSGPFMQALQFCWAVGFILAPLISHPFLTEEVPPGIDSHGASINLTPKLSRNESELTIANSTESFASQSQLYIPYGIAGSLVCFGSMIVLFLYIYEKKLIYEDKAAAKECDAEKNELKSEKENDTAAKKDCVSDANEPKSIWFTIWMVALSCLMVCFFCASEMTTFQYLPTFVVHLPLGLTKFNGSFILSALAGSFTVGRFSGILLAVVLKPEYILLLDWLIMLAGNLLLMLAVNSELLLWIGSMVLGFGFAAFFPAVFSFLKNRLDVTNIISAMILLSSLAGNACGFPILVGKYIEKIPLILIYGNFFCYFIIGLTFIGLVIVEMRYVKKKK